MPQRATDRETTALLKWDLCVSVFTSWSLKPGVRFYVAAELADPRSYWTKYPADLAYLTCQSESCVTYLAPTSYLYVLSWEGQANAGNSNMFIILYGAALWSQWVCQTCETFRCATSLKNHRIRYINLHPQKFSSSLANLPLCSRTMAKLLCGPAGKRHNHK